MDKQRTIKKELSVRGIGLHTANKVKVTFKPASEGSGINFIRTDLAGKPVIKASVDNLISSGRSPRRTSLSNGDAEVHTIEHLMAALAGSWIDNVTIEIDNEEVPGLDGSSLNFLEALQSAGIVEQGQERGYSVVKEPIFAEENGSALIALPSSQFEISYTLQYDHPMLKSEYLKLVLNPDVFSSEIAPARTFCLEDEALELQSQGVGHGANYENTLVIGEHGVIKNTLRFEDEFVRHKMLDLLGDLYLVGPIKAHIVAIRSGHSLNLKMVEKLCQQKKRYSTGGVNAGCHTQAVVLDTE